MLSFLFPKWCKPGKGPVGRMKVFEICPTADLSSAGPGEVASFVRHIAHLGLPLSLRWRYGQLYFRFLVQCKGPAGRIRLFYAVPDIRVMGFTAAFQTHFSGIYLLPASEDALFLPEVQESTLGAEGRTVNRGLLSVVPFAFKDPLNAMMMAMGAGELRDGEEVWLDMTFAPATGSDLRKRIVKAEKWLQSPANEPVSLKAIWREMSTDSKTRPKQRQLTERQSHLLRALQGKRSEEEPGFWTSFRAYIHSFSSKARLQTMNAALQSMRELNGILLHPVVPEKIRRRFDGGTPFRPILLTAAELASWLRLPDAGTTAAAHLQSVTTKMIAPPHDLNEGIFIGKSNVPGMEREIRMPVNQLLKHTFLAGTTGSGKTSTLLSIMVRMVRELERNPERAPGFTFLDPHGGGIETLLSHLPPKMYSKLHLIPLGATERPRGFNLFQTDHQAEAEALTGEFVTTLQQLFPGSRPRAEHYLRNAVLSLLSVPPQTVLGVVRIFLNEAYRRRILPYLDPHLLHFWTAEFAQIKNIGEHLGPILNKLGALLTYPTSRRMLGQLQSSVNIRRCMDEGHIVLIDGSGCVPDLLRILASLFMIDYHFTCRKRPPHASRPHFFFADEVHLFATDILAKILSEDRKFGLSLFLATQYLTQLPDRILEAILGNVGTLILLQMGGPDADRLTRWLKPMVSAHDLMHLPELHAIVRTKGHQGKLVMFTMKNEIVPIAHTDWIRQAWAHSDRQDGRSIEEVEREINQYEGDFFHPTDDNRGE